MDSFISSCQRYRFELFLTGLVVSLFGILLFKDDFFTNYVLPFALLANVVLGINLVSKRRTKLLVTLLFIGSACVSGFSIFNIENTNMDLLHFTFYFIFYVVMTVEIIRQVWHIDGVGKDLIMGVMSGYITLGLVGFFIFMAIEIVQPGSFKSSLFTGVYTVNQKLDGLLYFSYVTLLTIGYGDILPVTTAAQKAVVLLGLLGQFYMVLLTAITVGKYSNQANEQ